ncbi:hypothetical protein AC477_04520 [miscellaneous Crenarchaeota group-1 archaeon SG8-32-1]|uniref:Flavodoxin-like domain-containing protein n=1 Tax=miscellaneous Crenarchaeota group-1 archaeon SG8-32-1 TaxID=1685124 RepID=A0A0M0BRD7_9ARCH|nr:MAG: hypothetical protein AC477_04520 [miscellaneous Crenarchaeota group-1 archaeon SG8-32-1]
MKLWPKKRWKKILLIILLTIIIISVPLLIYASFGMNSDVITELVIMNPGGSKTALILYHPGLSSFSYDVSYSFAEGLISNNWRVEIATPSIEAPTDLSKYDLLVISSNTYAFNPDAPTSRHLERIGDLKGIKTVVITLGAGSAESSQKVFENLVESHNGTIIESLLLYNMAPNEGGSSATETAEQFAKEIN